MGGTLIGGPKDEDVNPDLEDGDKPAAVDLKEKPLQPGDRVEGKYRGRGRRYYKGTIKNVLPGDRYDVDYEDGDKDRGLAIEFIRRLPAAPISSPSTAKADDAHAERQNEDRSKVEVEPALTMDPVDQRTGFKIGQKVEAKYKGRGRRYYKGTVVEVMPNGLYNIDYEDGDRDRNLPASAIRAREGALNAEPQSSKHLEGRGQDVSRRRLSTEVIHPSEKPTPARDNNTPQGSELHEEHCGGFKKGQAVEARYKGRGRRW